MQKINKTESVEYLYKKTRLVLDSQKNIVIVTNGRKLIEANQAFFNFFRVSTLDEFLENSACICDHFIQEDGERYLKKISFDGKTWAETVLEEPEITHKAMIKDKNGIDHIFEVSGQRLQMEDCPDEEVMVFTDITKMEHQRIMISKMDIPILEIAEGITMVPLIGVIDSIKSQRLMENILIYVKDKETKVAVLDIQGIAIVDSAVAAHIVKITKATKLMGCETIISGISPEIAQTIVNLGIDVENMTTTANLKNALKLALKAIKFELVSL